MILFLLAFFVFGLALSQNRERKQTDDLHAPPSRRSDTHRCLLARTPKLTPSPCEWKKDGERRMNGRNECASEDWRTNSALCALTFLPSRALFPPNPIWPFRLTHSHTQSVSLILLHSLSSRAEQRALTLSRTRFVPPLHFHISAPLRPLSPPA